MYRVLYFVIVMISGCSEKLATPEGKSTNLNRDLSLMWETKALPSSSDPTHPPNPRASTERAINAAARVFKTVDLIGKTREEVFQTLGSPQQKSDSMYNFPFYPTSDDVLVFRFDNGAWGSQYNVVFDKSGSVSKVEAIFIE